MRSIVTKLKALGLRRPESRPPFRVLNCPRAAGPSTLFDSQMAWFGELFGPAKPWSDLPHGWVWKK